MSYTKRTVEISIFCEHALLRLVYLGIGEYISVPFKGVDD